MIDISIDRFGLFLIVFMFLSGTWNAAIGPGGGVTFATLAAVLSPAVAIPVHAVVEGASGIARAWILRDLIERKYLKYFVLGGLPGFGAGLVVLTHAPVRGPTLQSLVGLFIVASVWMPTGAANAVSGRGPFRLGAVTAVLGLFVGGMQVLVASSLRSNAVEQRGVVATSTVAVLYQFAVKLIIFGLVGFSFATYAGLLVVLTVASLAGTLLGSRLSVDLPERATSQLFKLIVTMIGFFIIGHSWPDGLGVAELRTVAMRPEVLMALSALVIAALWLGRSSTPAQVLASTEDRRSIVGAADHPAGVVAVRRSAAPAITVCPPRPNVKLSRLIADSGPVKPAAPGHRPCDDMALTARLWGR